MPSMPLRCGRPFLRDGYVEIIDCATKKHFFSTDRETVANFPYWDLLHAPGWKVLFVSPKGRNSAPVAIRVSPCQDVPGKMFSPDIHSLARDRLRKALKSVKEKASGAISIELDGSVDGDDKTSSNCRNKINPKAQTGSVSSGHEDSDDLADYDDRVYREVHSFCDEYATLPDSDSLVTGSRYLTTVEVACDAAKTDFDINRCDKSSQSQEIGFKTTRDENSTVECSSTSHSVVSPIHAAVAPTAEPLEEVTDADEKLIVESAHNPAIEPKQGQEDSRQTEVPAEEALNRTFSLVENSDMQQVLDSDRSSRRNLTPEDASRKGELETLASYYSFPFTTFGIFIGAIRGDCGETPGFGAWLRRGGLTLVDQAAFAALNPCFFSIKMLRANVSDPNSVRVLERLPATRLLGSGLEVSGTALCAFCCESYKAVRHVWIWHELLGFKKVSVLHDEANWDERKSCYNVYSLCKVSVKARLEGDDEGNISWSGITFKVCSESDAMSPIEGVYRVNDLRFAREVNERNHVVQMFRSRSCPNFIVTTLDAGVIMENTKVVDVFSALIAADFTEDGLLRSWRALAIGETDQFNMDPRRTEFPLIDPKKFVDVKHV